MALTVVVGQYQLDAGLVGEVVALGDVVLDARDQFQQITQMRTLFTRHFQAELLIEITIVQIAVP